MSSTRYDIAQETPPIPRGFEYNAYPEPVWETNPDVPSTLVGPQMPGPVMPQTNPKPPTGQGLGIAALVFGLVSVPLAFIPLLNVLSIITGTLAITLGVAALRRGLPKPISLLGMLAGVGGIAITTIVLGAVLGFNPPDTSDVAYPSEIPMAEVFDYSVEYNAWASGDALVSWGTGEMIASEPFWGSWSGFDTAFEGSDIVSVIEVFGEPGRLASCEILVNGEVVDQQSGVGSVSCQAPLK